MSELKELRQQIVELSKTAVILQIENEQLQADLDKQKEKAHKANDKIAELERIIVAAKQSLKVAQERIIDGVCWFCGEGDEDTELRYGMCFKCFIKA